MFQNISTSKIMFLFMIGFGLYKFILIEPIPNTDLILYCIMFLGAFLNRLHSRESSYKFSLKAGSAEINLENEGVVKSEG